MFEMLTPSAPNSIPTWPIMPGPVVVHHHEQVRRGELDLDPVAVDLDQPGPLLAADRRARDRRLAAAGARGRGSCSRPASACAPPPRRSRAPRPRPGRSRGSPARPRARRTRRPARPASRAGCRARRARPRTSRRRARTRRLTGPRRAGPSRVASGMYGPSTSMSSAPTCGMFTAFETNSPMSAAATCSATMTPARSWASWVDGAEVRRDDDVLELEDAARRVRLVGEDVERGAGDLARLERVHQRVDVDEVAAGGVHDPRRPASSGAGARR